ncbi:MAG: hydroxymethylbilane synthase [Gemmatimonadota bacterium]|nr:hydroxymethylbilane synthase [Gemmatimonadota bacterium]MDH5198325.1 hydroxymethylbilane synthase [Gemmatimonadota bacterium]
MTAAARAIRLGTRASQLARWQTAHIASILRTANPELTCSEVTLSTEGDRDDRTPLPEIGGKGVFTEALEAALRAGQIDVAVHSLKDVPVEDTPGLVLAALCFRTDPRDVVIAPDRATLAALPHGARVGTCSTRRSAQLLALRPDLSLAALRGNVDTRVRKALDGEYDAIVIAAAGVTRLGLGGAVTEYLPLERMLPAPGQGALAVQCRADDPDVLALVRALDDPEVRATTEAERAFLEGLGGGCAAPIAAHARVEDSAAGQRVALRGLVAALDGTRVIRVEAAGAAGHARAVGLQLAADARLQGAEALL